MQRSTSASTNLSTSGFSMSSSFTFSMHLRMSSSPRSRRNTCGSLARTWKENKPHKLIALLQCPFDSKTRQQKIAIPWKQSLPLCLVIPRVHQLFSFHWLPDQDFCLRLPWWLLSVHLKDLPLRDMRRSCQIQRRTFLLCGGASFRRQRTYRCIDEPSSVHLMRTNSHCRQEDASSPSCELNLVGRNPGGHRKCERWLLYLWKTELWWTAWWTCVAVALPRHLENPDLQHPHHIARRPQRRSYSICPTPMDLSTPPLWEISLQNQHPDLRWCRSTGWWSCWRFYEFFPWFLIPHLVLLQGCCV